MDDDQQFCLRWNNHQSTLISVFDTLLENETLVDCTLAAEGKFLKAHKVVLSACSPYFATLLQEQYDKHPIFILKDVKYQELRAMMDYMYRGEVNISQDQLAALLKAAESLQIKGLSDSRGGGGPAPKPEHHRGLNVPTGGPKLSGGYTLEQTKRARIGPSSMDSQEMCGSREGSSSPSRRRRKVRRRSIENALTDMHDNSNSSQMQTASTLQQQQQQQHQSNANISGVSAITAAASAALAAAASQLPTTTTTQGATASAGSTIASTSAPGTNQTTTIANKKTESGLKGTTLTTSTAGANADSNENMQQIGSAAATGTSGSDMEQDMEQQQQQSQHIVKGGALKENHHHKQKSAAVASSSSAKDQSELIIEPKSEYDDEGHEETVEDLTLDDEDMGMDDMDHNAGTSQGGEGSSQGYAGWPHDRSQDELLLNPQESQQRDPQDFKYDDMHFDAQELKYEFQTSMIVGENMNDRFPCDVCGKSYLRKRHLQRHRRDECIGIPPRFSCDMCPSRFRRKYHMVRHLTSKHSVPVEIAQQTTGQRVTSHNNNNGKQQRSTGGGVGGGGSSYNGGDCNASIGSGGSQNGCDSPIPENLSLRKYSFENSPIATGSAEGNQSPIPPSLLPTYGLTGAITAITAAAALVEQNAAAAAGINDDNDGENGASNTNAGDVGIGPSGELIKIKGEPVSPAKSGGVVSAAAAPMDDDWKMKLSLQLISSSLLKERLMNTMPFAYKNN